MNSQFSPVFTDIGRTAAATADGQGLSTVITHVSMGTGKYDVRDQSGNALEAGTSATALQTEQLKVPVYSGGSPAPGQLNIVAEVSKAAAEEPQFYISEIGFWQNDVLVAVWSSASGNLGFRGDLGSWYLSLALAWVDLPGDAFSVEVQNGPLAEQSVRLAQHKAQLEALSVHAQEAYSAEDATSLHRAVDARINQVVQAMVESGAIGGGVASLDGGSFTESYTPSSGYIDGGAL